MACVRRGADILERPRVISGMTSSPPQAQGRRRAALRRGRYRAKGTCRRRGCLAATVTGARHATHRHVSEGPAPRFMRAIAAVALVTISLAWVVVQAAGRQTAVSSDAPAAVSPRAAIDQYLHRLPQRSPGQRRAAARHARSLDARRARRRVGEGRAQAADARDAAGRGAPARRGDLSCADRLADIDARSRGSGTAQSRAAHAAASEPLGVRERDSRSAGARRRCVGAPACGRFRVRLRHHRRRARRVAVAPGAVSLGRGQDQRARGRRHDARSGGRDLPRASGPLAEPAPRGAAAWNGRRARGPARVPARRRIRVPDSPSADQLRQPARARLPAAGRDERRWRARPRGEHRRQRRPGDDVRASAERRRRDRSPVGVSREGEGGRTAGERGVHSQPSDRRHAAHPAVPAQLG